MTGDRTHISLSNWPSQSLTDLFLTGISWIDISSILQIKKTTKDSRLRCTPSNLLHFLPLQSLSGAFSTLCILAHNKNNISVAHGDKWMKLLTAGDGWTLLLCSAHTSSSAPSSLEYKYSNCPFADVQNCMVWDDFRMIFDNKILGENSFLVNIFSQVTRTQNLLLLPWKMDRGEVKTGLWHYDIL